MLGLYNSYVQNGDFRNNSFSRGKIVKTKLHNTSFETANLDNSFIEGSFFINCNLHRIKLTKAEINNTEFHGVSGVFICLRNAKITGLCLEDSMIAVPVLSYAEIKDSSIVKTHFENAEADCVIFDNCFFAGCSFNWSFMRKASFINSDLKNSSFVGAGLSEACFAGSILTHIDFSGADLKNTNFTNATIRDCVFDEIGEDEAIFGIDLNLTDSIF